MAIAAQGFKGFVVGPTEAAIEAQALSSLAYSPVAVVESGKVKRFGVVKGDGTGVVWMTDMTDVSYDATTAGPNATMRFTYSDGTTKDISLPKENFLSAGSYDQTTNILTLTLSDGSTVTVDMSDLVDVVGVANTATVNLANNSNVLSATVNISAEADNVLQSKADGLYVPEAEEGYIQSVEDTTSVALAVASGKLTASSKVSALDSNGIEIKSDGLYAFSPSVYVVTV